MHSAGRYYLMTKAVALLLELLPKVFLDKLEHHQSIRHTQMRNGIMFVQPNLEQVQQSSWMALALPNHLMIMMTMTSCL
jgi:hypothetical protein